MMLRKILDAVRERGPISRRITESALRFGSVVGRLPPVAIRQPFAQSIVIDVLTAQADQLAGH
jgi:hypothetical protein